MKKFLPAFLLILSLAFPARGEDGADIPQASLFFTPDEAHEAEALAEKTAPDLADIRLGAVMYYGPHDWTLWLQGAKWTPETSQDDLQVLEVTASQVRLSWRGDEDKAAREITLRPNEAYQIATGKIIASP